MPELPEAESTRRKLKTLIGEKAGGFWSDWPRALRVAAFAGKINEDIKGREILRTFRKGKAVFLGLSGGRFLVFHMRMSGSLTINKIKNSLKSKEQKHIRAKIFFKGGKELWFKDPRKFGVIWYGKEGEVKKEKYLASLGQDALSVSLKYFLEKFSGRKGMIKPLLLRQDIVCGIGNIIADEALWLAKIHPRKKAEDLDRAEIKNLFNSIKKVLRLGIKTQGATLRDWAHPDGQKGGFQNYMKIYGRAGKECVRCGSAIKKTAAGGRGTWFCPVCQKLN